MTNHPAANEQAVYGCATDQLRATLKSAMTGGSPFILPVSILSDAQELLATGENDRARQAINCAKWMIAELYGSDFERVFKAARAALNILPNQRIETHDMRTTYDLAAALGRLPLTEKLAR